MQTRFDWEHHRAFGNIMQLAEYLFTLMKLGDTAIWRLAPNMSIRKMRDGANQIWEISIVVVSVKRCSEVRMNRDGTERMVRLDRKRI